jgi:hypothetical protein
MRTSRIILVCACLVGLTQPARSQQSQQAKPTAPHGVPGYLDPQTGAFTPMPQRSVENEEELAATTPTTGKFVITFRSRFLHQSPRPL